MKRVSESGALHSGWNQKMRSVKPGVEFCTTRYSTCTLGSRYSQRGLRAVRFLALKLWVSGPGLHGMGFWEIAVLGFALALG